MFDILLLAFLALLVVAIVFAVYMTWKERDDPNVNPDDVMPSTRMGLSCSGGDE